MTTINVNLFDPKSIRQAQKQLQKYNQEIYKKCETFCNRLMDVGISVGKQNRGEYGKAIRFTKKYNNTKYGFVGTLEVTGDTIVREWQSAGTTRQEEINALLMAEFGSGFEADVRTPNVSGMGQGTFPGQTHAWDYGGWWWIDLDGNKHHSRGETPSYPVYSAWLEMKQQINSIALQVFRNGK